MTTSTCIIAISITDLMPPPTFATHAQTLDEWLAQPAMSVAWPLVYHAHDNPELLLGTNRATKKKNSKPSSSTSTSVSGTLLGVVARVMTQRPTANHADEAVGSQAHQRVDAAAP
jgi:hypothetical protein